MAKLIHHKTDILLVSHSAENSGAPRVLMDAASALHPAHFRVTISFPSEGEMSRKAAQLGYMVHIFDNPQIGFQEASSLSEKFSVLCRRIRYMLSMRKYIRKRRFDLIYLNSAAAVYAGIASLGLNTPRIWHIHENLSHSLTDNFRKAFISRLSDLMIFSSPTNKKAFGNRISRVKSMVIPNGVRMEKFSDITPDRDFWNKYNYKPGDIIIGTLSFLYHLKGIDILLRAAAKILPEFPNLKIVLTGERDNAPEEYIALLDKTTSELQLEKNIYYPGYCYNTASFLQTLTVFSLPSRTESMPLAVLEAMAAGCAITASDVGSVSEMLNHGECGVVVPPEDPDTLANALSELLRNKEKRRRLGEKAAKRVMENYSMKKFRKKIVEVIRETAGKK